MLIGEFLDAVAARVATAVPVVTTNPRVTADPPMAVIADEGEIEYHENFVPGDMHAISAVVTVYVSKADNAEGYLEAREYRSNHGDKSIRKAIETSLGDDDPLDDMGSLQVVSSVLDDDGPYISAVFTVTAMLPGEPD